MTLLEGDVIIKSVALNSIWRIKTRMSTFPVATANPRELDSVWSDDEQFRCNVLRNRPLSSTVDLEVNVITGVVSTDPNAMYNGRKLSRKASRYQSPIVS